MKKLILVLAMAVLFTGCKGSETNPYAIWIGSVESTDTEIDEYFDYTVIANGEDQRIVVDKNTGVMYYQIVCEGAMTPIYNADGSLKIYKEK